MRQRFNLAWPLRLAAVAIAVAGCMPSLADLDQGPLTSTFAVSDYFSPSGYMGDGEYFGNLVGQTNADCKPRPAGARGNCYSFTYYPNSIDVDTWSGVFWVFPSNSWGSTSGHAIDISKFTQISYYAAVDGPSPFTVNGGQIPLVGQAGGIDPAGYYANKGEIDYVDGVAQANAAASVGTDPGDVTPELTQFHVPLGSFQKGAGCVPPGTAGKAPNCTGDVANGDGQATFLIGAFAWALHYPVDSVTCRDGTDSCRSGEHSSQYVSPQPVHVYLDDIVWE